MGTQDRITICQISDIHCGSPYFIPDLLERSILEINDMGPTAVVVLGDLTNAGYRQEFETAAEYIQRLRCERVMVIPGNHDSRNVGYIHFERLFGDRYSTMGFDDAVMVAVDSSEPDLDDGRVGREHYDFIHETFTEAEDKLKIFVIHHHLIPIPGTGRERNIIYDAGGGGARALRLYPRDLYRGGGQAQDIRYPPPPDPDPRYGPGAQHHLRRGGRARVARGHRGRPRPLGAQAEEQSGRHG